MKDFSINVLILCTNTDTDMIFMIFLTDIRIPILVSVLVKRIGLSLFMTFKSYGVCHKMSKVPFYDIL